MIFLIFLIFMANLSPITVIKLFLFFLTLLAAFSFSLKHAEFIAFNTYFATDFVLDVLILVDTPRVYLIEFKFELTFTCFSLLTN